ncbi:hypothetical protein Tco_0854306 [Tanacetum coccineum]
MYLITKALLPLYAATTFNIPIQAYRHQVSLKVIKEHVDNGLIELLNYVNTTEISIGIQSSLKLLAEKELNFLSTSPGNAEF